MNLYRISLKLKSPIITPLKGDTIWGHYVWGISNHLGEKAVEEFLELCKTANPPLIVSSAFPKGTLCKPMPEVVEHEEISIEEYSNIKKNKKKKYISAKAFLEDGNGNDIENNVFKENMMQHNSINRFTNTVEDGGLYSVSELWVSDNQEFDLYIISSYDEDYISQLTEWAFENGYGADSSTGKGFIEVTSKPEQIKTKNKGNKYFALGPFIKDEKVQSLKADIFVRTGKIGGFFASTLNPFKKTVVYFDEGAVFESPEEIQFVGKLITDIHSDKRICQSGFAPVIPLE